MTASAFRAWRERLGLTRAAAASALGLSVRCLAHYEAGDRPVPRVVELACERVEERLDYEFRARVKSGYPLKTP